MLWSSQIGQQIHAQNAAMSGQAAYAQQLSYPMMAALNPGMQPPPPMPPPLMGVTPATAGMYGERFAGGLASTAGAIGSVGLGAASIAGGMGMLGPMGRMLDPFGMALSMGRGAYGIAGGGAMGAVAGLGAAALPLMAAYAGSKVVDVYGGAFMGGMQDQVALNSNLRQNFQFFNGGGGGFGRGFNQSQMGAIGGIVNQELRSNPMASFSELNQLISGGAQSGMFNGVRDVQDFSQKFRRMLTTLKDVQHELGGTLTEALSFVRSAKQSGIFSQLDRVNFAGEIRGTQATTGMSQDQLLSMSASGAQFSRAVGGLGRQGAFGALRTASSLGAAVQGGFVNEALLSEMTGGLQGAEAIQGAVGQIMQNSARFSRRGMGRFSIFALSNAEGTGLDADMLARFRAGDITVGEVSRRAHRNVGRMGRAHAINQEGRLRGSMLEEGGLAGQIGMMRLMLGDRVLDQGDDFASLVMQRRFGMDRNQAELMTSLIRNQGSIAREESVTRVGAQRQQDVMNAMTERGVDATLRNLSHSVQDTTGVTAVREAGRKFMTGISAIADRALNRMLGVVENELTTGDRSAISRVASGTASREDVHRVFREIGMGSSMSGSGRIDLDNRGGLAGALGHRASLREILNNSGYSDQVLDGAPNGRVRDMVAAVRDSRRGVLHSARDRSALRSMVGNRDASTEEILRAQHESMLRTGSDANFGRFLQGTTAQAANAFLFLENGVNPAAEITPGLMMSRSGGSIGVGDVLGDMARLATGSGSIINAAVGLMRGRGTGFNTLDALRQPELRSQNFADRLNAMNQRAATGGGVLGRIRAGLARAGIGGGLPSITGEQLSALTGNERIRDILGRHLEGDSGALGMLRREALGMEDEGQRNALRTLIQGISSGDVKTDELRGMMTTPERAEQMRREVENAASNFRIMGRRIGDSLETAGIRGGAVSGRIQNLLRGVSSNLIGGNEGGFLESQQQLIESIAGLDSNNPEAQAVRRALAQSEEGRSLLAEGAHFSQTERDLSGQGRGGRSRAVNSAFNMATGGTFGLMGLEFRSGGRSRRVRSANEFMQLLNRRGTTEEQRNQLMGDFRAGLEQMGISSDYADKLRGMFSDGRLDRGERDELRRIEREDPNVRKAQHDAVLRQQQQQNPLDNRRNEILERIQQSLEHIDSNTAGPGGVSSSEPN